MSKTPMTVSDLIGGYYILKYPKRQQSRRLVSSSKLSISAFRLKKIAADSQIFQTDTKLRFYLIILRGILISIYLAP